MKTKQRYTMPSDAVYELTRYSVFGDNRILVRLAAGSPYLLPLRLDIANLSSDGFAWGYRGSGPAQTALALLADALADNQRALLFYNLFSLEIIACLPRADCQLPRLRICAYIEAYEANDIHLAARIGRELLQGATQCSRL